MRCSALEGASGRGQMETRLYFVIEWQYEMKRGKGLNVLLSDRYRYCAVVQYVL
jgi:hypothetical protein